MYLLDTNVWLERLLDQERSEEVGQLLSNIPSEELFITDFAFHSIGVILARLNQIAILSLFVQDIFINGNTVLIHLEPEDTTDIVTTMELFSLDFDDSYQYVSAEKYNLTLVSFDSDFDNTEHGRMSPTEIVNR